MSSNVYEKVFGRVVEAMEQGVAPWVRPWQGGMSMPYNAVTGRQYSGGNVLALWASGMMYGSHGWLTFKQAIAEGCVVKEGQKGTAVYFMSQTTGKKEEGEEEGKRGYFFAKGFTVFNVEQLADLEEGAVAKLRAKFETAEPSAHWERIQEAERIVQATGAIIQHGGASASYVPSLDTICMPEAEKFAAADGYYSTLFHELSHWTGHEKRLNRVTPAKFGSPEYAFEELVAELSSAFLCGSLGIENVGQSAAYLSNWAKACRNLPDLLPKAASYANKAAAYVMGEQSAPVTVGQA